VKKPILLLIVLVPLSASALEWKYIDVDFALSWINNAQIGNEASGKQPSILTVNPGISFFADFDAEKGEWYFRPGAWLSWGNEEVYKGVARPAGEEIAGHMKILGLITDAHFGYLFPLSKLDIGVQGGPSLSLKIPLWTAQMGTGEPADFWRAYYGRAQFLSVSFASWATVEIDETTDFLAGLRFYLPLSNLWADAPFEHEIVVSIVGSFRFFLSGQ